MKLYLHSCMTVTNMWEGRCRWTNQLKSFCSLPTPSSNQAGLSLARQSHQSGRWTFSPAKEISNPWISNGFLQNASECSLLDCLSEFSATAILPLEASVVANLLWRVNSRHFPRWIILSLNSVDLFKPASVLHSYKSKGRKSNKQWKKCLFFFLKECIRCPFSPPL